MWDATNLLKEEDSLSFLLMTQLIQIQDHSLVT